MSVKCSEEATDGAPHSWAWCRETGNSTWSSRAHKNPTFSSLLGAATLFIPLGSGRKALALTFDTVLFPLSTIPVVTH